MCDRKLTMTRNCTAAAAGALNDTSVGHNYLLIRVIMVISENVLIFLRRHFCSHLFFNFQTVVPKNLLLLYVG